ncbi:MAG TPA: hypothetical protein VEU51_06645 [Candidatus Acidoferrales bacterium]|nr:hypothetical protein [Candidatus Acidoferrales bacterium]
MNRKFAVSIVVAAMFSLAMATTSLAHDMDDMDSASSGGSTGAMGSMGSHMKMGEHMTMTESRPMTPADQQRGELVIKTARDKLAKYQDSNAAIADGYVPYMPTVPQDVYHFASRERTMSEYMGDFDLAHPGALLYERQGLSGYKLVGAMYSAPASDTPDDLDKLIPLSLVNWHAHTNICLPDGVTEQDVMNGDIHGKMRPSVSSFDPMQRNANNGARMRFGYMADPRFGFAGTINTEDECTAVRGNFHPQIFGWMVHVYPFASDDFKVAFSHDAP